MLTARGITRVPLLLSGRQAGPTAVPPATFCRVIVLGALSWGAASVPVSEALHAWEINLPQSVAGWQAG